MAISAPDLTKRPPRSPRVRLGGFALLPRTLDKGRATIVKKNGEFHYNCPIDKMLFKFVGISAAKLKSQLAKGRSDGEILAWIEKNAKHDRSPAEINAWSVFMEQRAPSGLDGREFFHGIHKKIAPKRTDITTWFELLDADDHVTYGGKA